MTDGEITHLQGRLKSANIAWIDNSNCMNKIIWVAPLKDENGELCAFFSGGNYIALWNCDKNDFIEYTDLYK